MNVIFFGTDLFAQKILEFLLVKKVNVVAVVTRPDRPKGRSKTPSPPPVKQYLLDHEFEKPIYQPTKASSPEFVETLKKHSPDLFVVVSYGQIMKQNLLDLPTLGSINVHPSLLPKWRGPSPVQSAVLAGDPEVGVTIMEMSLEMDAGDIIQVAKYDLPQDMTFGEAEEMLCERAKPLLLSTIEMFAKDGKVEKIEQDHKSATYTKKIEPAQSFIDWNKPANEVHNFIRGMNPRPGARCWVQTDQGKKLLKIFRSETIDSPPKNPGATIFFNTKEGWVISCKNSSLKILDVQPEGKRKMNVQDFINGVLWQSFEVLL